MSYSQNDEERHILRSVGDKPGRLLDIGAYDGKTFSNTLALIERGWSGVLIEPACEPFAKLLELHGNNPNVTLIHGLVGLDRHCIKFWDSAGAVATTEQANYEKWKRDGNFRPPYMVPQICIDDLLTQFGGFDFINIDTEGTSVQIFKRIPIKTMQPRAICVEHDGQVIPVMQHAGGLYSASLMNGENVVLVRNR